MIITDQRRAGRLRGLINVEVGLPALDLTPAPTGKIEPVKEHQIYSSEGKVLAAKLEEVITKLNTLGGEGK